MERKGTLPSFVFSEELTGEAEPAAMSAGGHLDSEDCPSSGPAGRTLAPHGSLGPLQKLELKITLRGNYKAETDCAPFKRQGFYILTCEVLCKRPPLRKGTEIQWPFKTLAIVVQIM